jgi:uncharacterized protein (DUF4415 family)
MREKIMSEGILEVTQKDFEKMQADGITDESLLKPGKYKLRRRTKTATREELQPSNTRVEFQMKLDLDILKHFQSQTENEETETLQLLLNEKLRVVMESELKLKEVEKRLLNDKDFIAALAEEIKKAA